MSGVSVISLSKLIRARLMVTKRPSKIISIMLLPTAGACWIPATWKYRKFKYYINITLYDCRPNYVNRSIFVCLLLKYAITWRYIRWEYYCRKLKREHIWILPNLSFHILNLHLHWTTLFISPTKCTVLIKVASQTCVSMSVPSSGTTKCQFWNPIASGKLLFIRFFGP